MKQAKKKSKKTVVGRERPGDWVTIAGGLVVPLADVAHIEEQLRALAVPIDSLKPDPRNARLHPEQNIQHVTQLLRDLGQQSIISVDGAGIILKGNCTWQCAKSLGWKYIARVQTSLTGTRARQWAIGDNRSAELAEWDREQLDKDIQEISNQLENVDVGFTDEQLEALKDDDFDLAHAFAPVKPKPPKVEEEMLEAQFKIVITCANEKDHRRVIELCEKHQLEYTAPSV